MFSGAMSERTFKRLSELIHTQCGIKMPPSKKVMLEGRIRKRLRVLGMNSIEQYCEFLLSEKGFENELVHAIDVVTTNKTDFFREPGHFEFLLDEGLPELVSTRGWGMRKRLNVWSAGCSTGEEPYSIAMVLREFANRYQNFTFSILATDISTKVLDAARAAVYDEARVEPVPMAFRKSYLLRSKDRSKKQVKIAPELRALVKFRRLNFMEEDFGISEPVEIIFCRNVIIYFDRPTQQRLLSRFCSLLTPGGYLFMGHSETLNGMDLPLINLGTTVYKKL